MWAEHPANVVNIRTVIEKQQQFLCDFVDIKAEGWRKFSRSFNNLTYGFWAPCTIPMDKAVEQLAESMKLTIKFK